jgi:hypothetical protein
LATKAATMSAVNSIGLKDSASDVGTGEFLGVSLATDTLILSGRRYQCIAANHGRLVESSRRGARSVGDYAILPFDSDAPRGARRVTCKPSRDAPPHHGAVEIEALAQYYANMPHSGRGNAFS